MCRDPLSNLIAKMDTCSLRASIFVNLMCHLFKNIWQILFTLYFPVKLLKWNEACQIPEVVPFRFFHASIFANGQSVSISLSITEKYITYQMLQTSSTNTQLSNMQWSLDLEIIRKWSIFNLYRTSSSLYVCCVETEQSLSKLCVQVCVFG